MKLYNMGKQEWRGGHFRRGDSWRSWEVYECHDCRTRTNRWVMSAGFNDDEAQVHCPGWIYIEHIDLEELWKISDSIDDKLNLYARAGIGTQFPDISKALRVEKDAVQYGIRSLQSLFQSCHDVVGEGVSDYPKWYINYARHSSSKKSLQSPSWSGERRRHPHHPKGMNILWRELV